METSETTIRFAAQKLVKSLNRSIVLNDETYLPPKIVQEMKEKFRHLPNSLTDLESEIMNFNAQLSCQGTIKDDVGWTSIR